jgi:hypothetical protein
VPTHFFIDAEGTVIETISQFEHEIARVSLELFGFIEPEDGNQGSGRRRSGC